MRLIWPKKPVSNELVQLTIQNSVVNSSAGFVYHDCYGVWFKCKGVNIIYNPFGNGVVIVVRNTTGWANIKNRVWLCTSLSTLIGLVRSLRQGGDV
jgi:hypothetical protein